jgi:uncharacterized protein (DUF849 family)
MLTAAMMVRELPQDCFWSLGGIGRHQLRMNAAAVIFGGGIRVGLEDTLFYDDERRCLATNASLVDRAVRIAAAMDRRPYSSSGLRRALALPLNKASKGHSPHE